MDCYRHFMIDVWKDQECTLSGDSRVHKTLEDLVNHYSRYPLCPYNEILTVPCGQKSKSAADYQELFEHCDTQFTTPGNRSNIPLPVPGPVHKSGGTGIQPQTVLQQECPPLPPKRLRPDSSQEISAVQNGMRTKLYPSIPQGTPASVFTDSSVPTIQNQQVRRHTLMKTQSLDSLHFTDAEGNGDFSATPHSSSNMNNISENEVTRNSQQNTLPTPVKPLKACRKMMTKAVSLVTEGQIAQDFKSMENAMAARMKNIHIGLSRSAEQQKVSPKPKPRNQGKLVPEEYKPPPPFAPGYC
ncbi:hematopoietic SH2 domain-containing protein isoform X2 [Bombina bombina]|nr:hematopoietic SH2 domain-containing protein isoform X2 [Bombina bombina]